jgi:gamma-glutamylaminecyclotransferase
MRPMQGFAVFVYGTLMRGEHHHDVIEASRFLGEAHTLPAYDFVLIDYFPALIQGGSRAIEGELYEVDAATLAALDALEEVPALYVRERITLADGRSAETYLLPRERALDARPLASDSFRRR